MKLSDRPIHEDFQLLLGVREQSVVNLFGDLRAYVLSLYPNANELLYHTHALTAVFSLSEKLSDAFCHIPVYTAHLNLGFNKGTLLADPHQLLVGTGKLIRHLPIKQTQDYRNPQVEQLILSAIDFSLEEMEKPCSTYGKTIVKFKQKRDL